MLCPLPPVPTAPSHHLCSCYRDRLARKPPPDAALQAQLAEALGWLGKALQLLTLLLQHGQQVGAGGRAVHCHAVFSLCTAAAACALRIRAHSLALVPPLSASHRAPPPPHKQMEAFLDDGGVMSLCLHLAKYPAIHANLPPG